MLFRSILVLCIIMHFLGLNTGLVGFGLLCGFGGGVDGGFVPVPEVRSCFCAVLVLVLVIYHEILQNNQ